METKLKTIDDKRKFYLDVVANWTKDSNEEIGKRWGITAKRVSIAAGRLTRHGIRLRRKNGKNEPKLFTPGFVAELRAASPEGTLLNGSANPEPAQIESGLVEGVNGTGADYLAPSKTCAACGNKFFKANNITQAYWQRKMTCSKRCYWVWMKGLKVAAGSPDVSEFEYSYCQSKYCPKPDGKYVSGTGVSGVQNRGLVYCSPGCREDAEVLQTAEAGEEVS